MAGIREFYEEQVNFYRKQADFYKKQVEFDNRYIELVTNDIKRVREEDRKCVEYVKSKGAQDKYDKMFLKEGWESVEIKNYKKDRRRWYTIRKHDRAELAKYEAKLTEYEAKLAETP